MKKYNYGKKIMFYVHDNNLNELTKTVDKLFKATNINIKYSFLENNYIKINFNNYDLNLEVQLNYDDSLFEYCYVWSGVYFSNKFKGTRSLLNKLYSIIKDRYPVITKKEPVFCKECNDQIGWFFNDYSVNSLDNWVSGYIRDKIYQKRLLECNDVVRCIKCNSFYCDCCADIDYNFEDSGSFICDSCDNNTFENYKDNECDGNCYECIYDNRCHYEDNILASNWAFCEFDDDDVRYKICDNCEHRENCIERAEDSKFGYEIFCDSIVGHGYDSMDDFWDSNGI